jgi:predicted ester cyclase
MSLRGRTRTTVVEDKELVRRYFDELSRTTLIAGGGQVVVPFPMAGVHSGECLGVAPTGKRVSFRGFARLRVEDGRITEDEPESNVLEVLLNR